MVLLAARSHWAADDPSRLGELVNYRTEDYYRKQRDEGEMSSRIQIGKRHVDQVTVDSGHGRVPKFQFECSEPGCKKVAHVNIMKMVEHGRSTNLARKIIVRARKQNPHWYIDEDRDGRDLCVDHYNKRILAIQKKKRDLNGASKTVIHQRMDDMPNNANPDDVIIPPAPPKRELSPDEIVRMSFAIFAELTKLYDKENKRYIDDWTDEKVAACCDFPVERVRTVRELQFGPVYDEPAAMKLLEQVSALVIAVREDLDSGVKAKDTSFKYHSELTASINKLIARLNQSEARLTKALEELNAFRAALPQK